MNEILLRRKKLILLEENNSVPSIDSQKYVATMMKNIEDLGYTFSKELFDKLTTYSKDELGLIYIELIRNLKSYVGANIVYRPMYPNFPTSVMEMDEFDLYFNAIMHYWSEGTLYPIERKDERLPLFEDINVKVIGVGTEKDLTAIFVNLVSSKTSISQTDKDDIKWFFESNPSITQYLPSEIPFKENVALIGKLYIENSPIISFSSIDKYFKTATDVLRLITCMSDGDISLAENTKFRNFKRKERRLLLQLLNNCGNIEEDMVRYKNKWIRVGEKLHPSEYNYENVSVAFDKIRNNKKIETFGGRLDKAYKEEDYAKMLNILKSRGGELARKLDLLLRKSDDKNLVINTFKGVSSTISTNVLLQVKEHFTHRFDDKPDIRVFFPKGNVARAHVEPNNLEKIDKKYCDAIVKICENALIDNYKQKDFLGNVYLSEDFKNYLIPFSQRSASKSLKTIVRGSKLPINDNAKVVRGFIWWTNNCADTHNRIDVDLSSAIFDENWNYLEHVSYTNLRSNTYNACHSGDIVNGGSVDGTGVSEFLDVDIDSVVKYGGRYIVYQVYNYSEIKYSDMTHCMFGYMEREDVNSGEIYEPKTVSQKMDLTSQSTVCIPMIFDCIERKMIWCDMNVSLNGCHSNYGGNNLESNLSGVSATCYGMVNMIKPNLYDLINLHIKARGLFVDNKEDADVIFDIEDGIKPFDTDVFMSEYI